MTDLFSTLPEKERESLKEDAPSPYPNPMLAVLVQDAFSHPDWIYERKLDGERVLTTMDQGQVRLVSRNEKKLNASYPEIVEALKTAWAQMEGGDHPSLVLDGEVVAFSDSVTSFSRLQERMQIKDASEARESPVAVYYYVFDILHLGGYDTRPLPLRSRKRLLKSVLEFQDPLRFTAHVNENGEEFHRDACSQGWEGVMAKRAGAPYKSARSRDWQKFKCVNRQELVIGGYTDPGGSRKGFGALLVGYFSENGDKLVYAGKVGTGFDEETLGRLHRLLKRRQRKTPPFFKSPGDLPRKEVHWVTPNLVGQFGFTEWTEAGKLRHPRFLGLRRDKDPEDVVREEPK